MRVWLQRFEHGLASPRKALGTPDGGLEAILFIPRLGHALSLRGVALWLANLERS